MRRKILYVGGFELPDKNAAAHRVVSNGKIVKELEYEIIFVGISHDPTLSGDIFSTMKKSDWSTEYQIRYPRRGKDWINYLGSIRGIKRVIEFEDISMVIAYNFPAIALCRMLKYCNARDIPIVGDCTEWEVSSGGGILFRVLKSMDTWLRMRIIHPRLNGIIAISKYLWNYYSPLNKNVILVPPLVDKADGKWNIVNTAKPEVCPVLTFAGSIGNEKDDLGILLRSLLELRTSYNVDFKLNVVGITSEEYSNEAMGIPVPAEIEGDVIFHGRLSNQQVIEILQHSDFSIFIREINRKTRAGFPTKFVESLASGTPVLTNESSDLKDYLIEDYNGYFLDVSSKSKLTYSLKEVLTKDVSKFQELKKNCDSSNEFDFRHYIGAFNKLFLNIKP